MEAAERQRGLRRAAQARADSSARQEALEERDTPDSHQVSRRVFQSEVDLDITDSSGT